MNPQNEPSSDLRHFLKLALAQVQHKLSQKRAAAGVYDEEMRRLLLLEELLKEQVISK